MAIYAQRRFYLNGHTGNLYVADTDPATDPYEGSLIKDGDLWTDLQTFAIKMRENGAWVQKNHWDEIDGKPTEFLPQPHGLESDRHSGNLPITRVDGHDLRNRVHIQSLAMANLGPAGPATVNTSLTP